MQPWSTKYLNIQSGKYSRALFKHSVQKILKGSIKTLQYAQNLHVSDEETGLPEAGPGWVRLPPAFPTEDFPRFTFSRFGSPVSPVCYKLGVGGGV